MKAKSVEELAKEIFTGVSTELPVDHKFTESLIMAWLESKSELTCPYCGSTNTVSTEVADIGKCLNPICKHKLFLIKSKQYATGEL